MTKIYNKRWKGKVASVHAVKVYRGSRKKLPSFLTSPLDEGHWATSRRDRFTPRKEPKHPLSRRLGGPQSRSERIWGTENLLVLLSFEIRTVQPTITMFLKLSRYNFVSLCFWNSVIFSSKPSSSASLSVRPSPDSISIHPIDRNRPRHWMTHHHKTLHFLGPSRRPCGSDTV